jgi:large subunit ribosomal protein L3
MVTTKRPRRGSLQYWPRKRAKKVLPRVNWKNIHSEKPLKGFICYKAGMLSAYAKDNTPDSLTSGKNIALPVTVLECPAIKIFSTRFYKNSKVIADILSTNLDKELKRVLKLPKDYKKTLDSSIPEDYDDVSVICYSSVKSTGMKKAPDLVEIGLNGTKEEKLAFAKENQGKELSVKDYFGSGQLVDIRGVTKGKGTQGPVRRFGIKLKRAKSEKGRRRPGSIGPWHPARVTFRVPMMGQTGLQTRPNYNKNVISIESGSEKPIKTLKKYGEIKTDYIILTGSVQGPAKRQVVMTAPLRKTKKQDKKSYDLIELR